MKTLLLISLFLSTGVWAQTHGTYQANRPIDCRVQQATFVHQMRSLIVSESEDEFVVTLESREGHCDSGFFVAEPLVDDYEATFIPERIFMPFREPFEARYEATENIREGRIIMRFNKRKLFKKHASQRFDFYYEIYGKTRAPLYFKWLVSLSRQTNGHIKLDMNYLGVKKDQNP